MLLADTKHYSTKPIQTRISKTTIGKAIASFERTVISKDSPFDKWMSGDSNAISDSTKSGYGLFVGKAQCSVCPQDLILQTMDFII